MVKGWVMGEETVFSVRIKMATNNGWKCVWNDDNIWHEIALISSSLTVLNWIQRGRGKDITD